MKASSLFAVIDACPNLGINVAAFRMIIPEVLVQAP